MENMTGQLALDLSPNPDGAAALGASRSEATFPDLKGPSLLRVVPCDGDLVASGSPGRSGIHTDGQIVEWGGERMATVHRLFADVLAAEPTVVTAVRRSAVSLEVPAAPPRIVGRAVYRRRRVLVAAVMGLLVAALSLAGGELAGRITGTPGIRVVEAAVEPVTYLVQPGDTLWSIAAEVNPAGGDIRRTVDRLVEANGGPVVEAGQQIVLSVG
ncbi:MAG TPA: hypothetical protein DGF10_08120 [Acidimicrobiaceae bacterium]|nr:hypothetical protein [Acidimicrobiaceae bacterium]|tara:strand:+ start:607 stop:1248 length:642 start_codon:yes stop_codon:yes gene_type:complete